MRVVLFCLVVSANALPEAHLRGRVKDHLRDRDLSVPEDAKNHYANTDASSDEISATNLEEGGFGLGLRRLFGLASIKGTLSHEGASKDIKSKAETAYATGGHARPVLETEVSPRDQDTVSQHKTQGVELADAHKKGGDAIDAAAHGDGDPAASIKGTLSHEGASKDIKSKAETAYATGGHARPVLETEVSPRDQDTVSQHKTQGADAELADAHNKGGDAIDAAAHGDGDPAASIKGTLSHVEDAPQTITSEAAAFDTEDIERVAGEGEALSGSTARNAAAEMIKSRLATQTTRPTFEQGFAGTRRRLQEPCGALGAISFEECPDDPGSLAYCDAVPCGELCLGWNDACGLGALKSPFRARDLLYNCGSPYDVYRKYCEPNVLADTNIRDAVALWFDDREEAIDTYGNIKDWDTSRVTDMEMLFCYYPEGNSNFDKCVSPTTSFNDPIGDWDTSRVTSMYMMFRGASSFDQPLNTWKVDKVKSMGPMFEKASAFNQPLDGWIIDQVGNMNDMFDGASDFDQALGWCVQEDVGFSGPFSGSKCSGLECGVIQGNCPNPEAATGEYCKLSDPDLCSGSRLSFAEVPSNPFAGISGNRYAVPTLADVDGDGNDDLLVGREDGKLAFYRNTGSEFQHVVGDEDPFQHVAVVGKREELVGNSRVGGSATPVLVDLDGDGNQDLVVGAADGSLTLYRRDADSPFQAVATDGEWMVSALDQSCTDLCESNGAKCSSEATFERKRDIDSTAEVVTLFESLTGKQCSSSDLLSWDVLPLFYSSGSASSPCIGKLATWANEKDFDCDYRGSTIQRLCWCWSGPFRGTENPFLNIDVDAHSAPAFADLDGDGRLDLVIGQNIKTPLSVIGQRTAGPLTYYRNVGSSTNAEFELEEDGPFQNVLVGSYSKPTFYDLDNDGDQDLIVGDDIGDVLLYLNVGSRFVPSFTIVDDTFAGITPVHAAPTFGVLNGVSSLVVGSAPGQLVVYGETPKLGFVRPKLSPISLDGEVGGMSKPTFVDLDNDGDLDLVVGNQDGRLTYWRNDGTRYEPNFVKVCSRDKPEYGCRVLVDEYVFDDIDVGSNSKPTFADLDGDGKLDLIVGQGDWTLLYYRNKGTKEEPDFQKVVAGSPFEDPFEDIERPDNGGGNPERDSNPIFADIDDDDDLDLVVGTQSGRILYYRNDGDSSQPDFTKVNDVDSPFSEIDVSFASAPTFVDLDRDGTLDLVVGGGGGLHYWRNVGTPQQPDFVKVDGEESPLDGIVVQSRPTPAFAALDNVGDLNLVVGSASLFRFLYFENVNSCRKGPEAGACSGNGFCGAFQGGKASCECGSTSFGARCDACAAGAGGPNCELCEAGTYSVAFSDECTTCDRGKTSNAGASFCFDCAAGKSGSGEQGKCERCVEGKSAAAGQASCELCEPGKFTNQKEQAECDLAKPGFYVVDKGATFERACSAGEFSGGFGATECASCPPGVTSGEGAAQCEPCDPGYFVAGPDNCELCPAGKTSTAGSSICSNCPAGTYDDQGECTPCAEGTFAAAGQASCEQCDFGRFAPDTRSSVCVLAAPGSYVDSKGATFERKCSAGEFSGGRGEAACTPCPSGLRSGEGAVQCEPCEPGYFVAGPDNCELCPAGKTSTGISGCFDCAAGTSKSEGQVECTDCVPGTFAGAGQATCTECTAGRFARDDASPTCALADAGYFVAMSGALEQLKCAKGSFSSGSANFECTSCEAGKYADEDGLDACKPAGRGHYVKDEGATKQEKCSAGTYSSGEGATSCTDANSGFYVEDEGATGQELCPEGTFSSNSKASSCDDCPKGEFTDEQGQSSCKPASPGHFVDKTRATEEEECSTGEYASGSGNQACTKCEVGKYAPNTGMGDCVSADPGHYVEEAGADAQKDCAAGSYAENSGSRACLDASAGYYVESPRARDQKPCDPGKFSGETGATECDNCDKGRFANLAGSVACALAEAGYYAPMVSWRATGRPTAAPTTAAPGEFGSGETHEFTAPDSTTSGRRRLTTPEGCAWYVGGPVVASQSNQVATVDTFENYELTFTMELASDWSITDEFQSVFHIGDTNGDRLPGIWFNPSQYGSGLHVMQSYSSSQWGVQLTTGITFVAGETYEIKVVVANNQMTVYVDGVNRGSASGSATYAATDAAVYVGDPWYDAAKVTLSDICLKQIVYPIYSAWTGGCLSTDSATYEGLPLANNAHSAIMEIDWTNVVYSGAREWILVIGQREPYSEHWLWEGDDKIGFGTWSCDGCSSIYTRVNSYDITTCDILATTYSAEGLYTLYCNGEAVASQSSQFDGQLGFDITDNRLLIGLPPPAAPAYEKPFSGCIKGLEIYDVALSSDSVASYRQPTATCPDVCDQMLKLFLTTDQFPSETTWSLTSPCGGASGGPSSSQQNTLLTESVEVCAGQTYTFAISDSYGDGICCSYGDGSYYLELNGAEIYSSNGDFGSGETFEFTAPDSATPAPTVIGTSAPSAAPTTTLIVLGAVEQLPCQVGKFSSSGASECEVCEIGKFDSRTDADLDAAEPHSSCTSARRGYFVDQLITPARFEEECPKGKYANNEGSFECNLCEKGKFADKDGEAKCTAASPGYFVNETGASEPTQCPLGEFSDTEERTACRRADPGFFVNTTGAANPTPCRAGTYSSEIGALNCNLCEAGTYAAVEGLSSCTSADPGFYVPGEGALEPIKCSSGRISGNAAPECRDCSLGTYAEEPGSKECTLAAEGYFVGDVGSSSPTECADGTYTNAKGRSTCLPSAPGKEVNGDKTGQVDCLEGETSKPGENCRACDPGSYASAVGSKSCMLADAGFYVKDSDTTQQFECPAGRYAPGPGTVNECLACAVGTFAPGINSTECTPAAPGSYVDKTGASNETQCKAGTYTNAEGSSTCLRTEPGKEANSERTGQVNCLEGETSESGGVCKECTPGFYAGAEGSSSCDPAEAGHYVKNSDRTQQFECPAGRYAPGPGTVGECLACAVGTFTNVTGSENCTSAAPGFYVGKTGEFEEKECKAGTYTKASGQSACLPATPGFYVRSDRASKQEECDKGKFSGSGQSECDSCPSGSYANYLGAASCEFAPKGSYIVDSKESPQPCLKGTYAPGPGLDKCIECSLGSFAAGTGAVKCELAAAGSFVDKERSSEQKQCPAGSYTKEQGQSACLPAAPGTKVPTKGWSKEPEKCPEGEYSGPGAEKCTPCEKGTFADKDGTVSCNPAEAGSFVANSGASDDKACEPGKYSPGAAATVCISCAVGSFSDKSGAFECTPADQGHFVGQTGSTKQTKCDAGRYTDTEGQSSCLPANPGTYVPKEGASSPIDCDPGRYSGSAQSSCQECAAGRFAANKGTDTCTLAEPGFFVAGTSVENQSLLHKSFAAARTGATKEEECSRGSYSPGEGGKDCIRCSLGTFAQSNKADRCELAERGHYVDKEGASEEKECKRGTYTDAEGQSSCLDAKPGFFVDADGASEQEECPPGQTSEPAATACESCDPGSFAAKPGAPRCELAQAGFYVPENDSRAAVGSLATEAARTAAVPCPKGRYSPGPGSRECILCAAGTYAESEQSTQCEPAKRGWYVEGEGAFEEKECKRGTYTETEGQSSCRDAKPGSFVASDGAWEEKACARGKFSGPAATACDDCEAGSYAEETGQPTCQLASPGHFVKGKGATKETPCAEGFYAPSNGADECILCALGTYADAKKQSSCKSASRGWFVDKEGASQPKKCERGTYTDTVGQSSCLDARAGYYVASDGASEQKECPKGETSDPAADKCEVCPDGSFASAAGSPTCTLAEAGHYVKNSDRTREVKCPVGHYAPGPGTADECLECAAGTFAATEGTVTCDAAKKGYHVPASGAVKEVKCKAGTYTNTEGQSSCLDARPGYYVSDDGTSPCRSSSEETACSAGEFSGPGATSCTPCDPGSYTEDPGTATCSLAKAGHYVKDSDRTKEIPCEKGYYSPGPGASSCFACSAGSFSEAAGATKCTFAKPGWFVAVEGDSKETKCPVGKYAIDEGSSRCTSAAAGSFVDAPGATEPTLCAPGRFAASSEATKCEDCPEGYYAADEGTPICSLAEAGYRAASPGRRLKEGGARGTTGATTQLPCEPGSYSLSGSSECISCSAGKFAALERAIECVSAEPGCFVAEDSASKEEPCPAGSHASGSGNSECTLCEPGKYAASAKTPDCTLATQGYFVVNEGATTEVVCPVGTYSPGPGLFGCVEANSGSFVGVEGAFVQEECPVGKFSSSPSSTECSLCPKGEFNSETGKSGCKPATSGHFVASEGASREEPCQPGTFASGSGNVECSDCNPGSYSDADAASACTRAKHGHFVAEPRATSPEKCEVGRYAPGEGSSSCTDANAGFYVADEAAKKQTPCPPGSYSVTAASTCNPCAAGEFSADEGKASCTSCAAGKSSPEGATDCSKCERGTAKPAGPGECTSCEPGRFADKKGRGECQLTDAGFFVEESGAFEQKQCLPGTYSPGAGAVECTPCEEGRYVARKQATACDLASGGEYVATTGATKPSKCTAGRFSGSGASSCEPCEPGTVSEAGASGCALAEAGVATNANPSYVFTLDSSLELEGYLDSQKNRSALAGLLNEIIEDLADQPVVVTIEPALSQDAFSSANSTDSFSNNLLFAIEANYTGVWGENMDNVSALMLEDFQSQFLEAIETGTLQERLDASDVLAPAAVDVDASLDGVRRSKVNFIRVGPPGSFDGLTRDCPAGKFSQSGASECSNCLEGTYTSKSGQSTCQPCVPFSTTIDEGKTGCFTCLQGYYRVPFMAGTSGVSCSNTSALQEQCASEEDPNDCVFNECCKSCDDLGSGVNSCPKATTLEALPVKPRYWRATELEETIYRCYYRKSCKGSLQPGPNQTSYGDGLCRKGHKGPLCNVCEKNHYFSFTNLTCDECAGTSTAVFVLIVITVFALLAALLYVSLHPDTWEASVTACVDQDCCNDAVMDSVVDHAERRSSETEDKAKQQAHTEAAERSSPKSGPAEARSSDASVGAPAREKKRSTALTKLKIVIGCYQIVSGVHPLFPTIPLPSVRK